MTIKCPDCKRDHAVHWKVGSTGKRTLRYICDHHMKMVVVGRDNCGLPIEELRSGTAEIQVDYAAFNLTPKEAEKVQRGIWEIEAKLREFGKKRSELATLELDLGL